MTEDHLSTGAPTPPLFCIAHELFIPDQIREETMWISVQSWIKETREHI